MAPKPFANINTAITKIPSEKIKRRHFFGYPHRRFSKLRTSNNPRTLEDAEKQVIIPLLEKGANASLNRDAIRHDIAQMLKKKKITEKMAQHLADTILFYEPSPSVRAALSRIGLSLHKNGDFDKLGKTALEDLKKLIPYFSSEDSKEWAKNIVGKFDGLTFLIKDHLKSDNPNKNTREFLNKIRSKNQEH